MLECRCGDDRIGEFHPPIVPKTAGAFGDRIINQNFVQRSEQLADVALLIGVTGEEFDSRDDRIRDAISAADQGSGPADEIDEYVGVDEDVSHAAPLLTRRHDPIREGEL